MKPPVPTFAIIGHPNEGKSSVVATLAEDDGVRISPVPGETTQLERFDLKVGKERIMEFVDTPGFQNPSRTLAWFRANAEADDLVANYIQEHQKLTEHRHDCELMRPVADGAGILYVVDGSRPITSADQAEMEILRLTGKPRMAIINSKDDDTQFIDAWKAAFRKSFNAIRIFNACGASFVDRIDLLDALKSVDQDWSPGLEHAVSALRKDWKRREERVFEVIVDLLEQALNFNKSKLVSRESDLEMAKPDLEANYRKGLEAIESRAWAEIRRQYRHKQLSISLPDTSILNEDLFSDKTWQAFGLTGKQLTLAASAAGAGLGVGLDVAAGGIAFGIFTAAGAAVGAGAAILKGKDLAKLKVRHIPVGGFKMQIGPNKNPQFPFILLDRAILYAQHASNWAHARQNREISISDTSLKEGSSSSWTARQRGFCMTVFEAIRKRRFEKLDKLYPDFKDILAQELKLRHQD